MLERTGPALGLEAHAHYEEHEFQLDAGDRLMLYTDGVLEGGAESPSGEDMACALVSNADRAELLGNLYQAAIRGVTGERDDITMLLMERAEGISHFDDAARPQERHKPEPATTQPQLLQGTREGEAFICIAGSVTWLYGQALLNCANTLLEQCGKLTVDLDACEYMDSTCQGTLHEIVTSQPDAVHLQGVSDGVRKLFDELSMTNVLEHISPEAAPLPQDMAPVDCGNLSPDQQGARILSSHETLASLSEHNREQFRAVVDSLRSDLKKDD